jgi:hypothetical protein
MLNIQLQCEICNRHFKNLRALSQHITVNKFDHILTANEYYDKYDTIREVFNKSYKIDLITNCWVWLDNPNVTGYCSIGSKPAHRVSYELHIGLIEENKELCVCHKCDNPVCVNPEHLFLGTRDDNNKDKVSKDRQARLFGSDNPMSKQVNRDKVSKGKLGKSSNNSENHWTKNPKYKDNLIGNNNPNSKAVLINGIEYSTLKEAASSLGVVYQTVWKRIKNGVEGYSYA